MQIILKERERQLLIQLHKKQKDKRNADRIKTILLLNKGLTQKQVAEYLFLDEDSITNYKKSYLNRKDETTWFLSNYKSNMGKLSYIEISRVLQYTDDFKTANKSDIKEFIKQSLNIDYKPSGIQKLLKRIGVSYTQLHRLPGKADIHKQKEFINNYNKIVSKLTDKETIVFADAVHPLHNSTCSKIWNRIGQIRWINSNTGRKRININGAYNPFNQDVIFRTDDTINAISTIKLLEQIDEKYNHLDTVYVFVDNARANKNKALTEWLKSQNRIKMRYLPPYSPNLNFIERLWKFMRKKVINTKYYSEFEDFKKEIMNFFNNIKQYKNEIAKFIGLKFQTFENINI